MRAALLPGLVPTLLPTLLIALALLQLEAARKVFLESKELAALRSDLAGDDSVAGRNFEHFIPPSFERAYLEAQGELPD